MKEFGKWLGITLGIGTLGGVIALFVGAANGNQFALVVSGAIGILIVIVLAAALVFGILWVYDMMSARRSREDQRQDLVEAKEQIAVMAAMQRLLNQQNQFVISRQKALPAPEDAFNLDALLADTGVYEEIEG